MLCSRVQLVKHLDRATDIRPLPCRSWGCDYCQPARRARLIAEAVAGKANRLLTLTVNPAIGQSPTDRRHRLHHAWRLLTQRINRQLGRSTVDRWQLHTPLIAATIYRRAAWLIARRNPRQSAVLAACAQAIDAAASDRNRTVRRIIETDDQNNAKAWRYFAFVEATKRGEPHLHILLRARFIPQDWISEQMADIADSPIVDIRQIHDQARTAGYVAKYVTKAPAQFGNCKRYWSSNSWPRLPARPPEDQLPEHEHPTIALRRWDETTKAFPRGKYDISITEDGWHRFIEKRGRWLETLDHVAVHFWLKRRRWQPE